MISRRDMFGVLGSAPAAISSPKEQQISTAFRGEIVNFGRSPHGANEFRLMGSVLHVDGKPVNAVFYVNTLTGIVKSYDVLGDGKIYASFHAKRLFPDGLPPNVVAPFDPVLHEHGVMYKTFRGRIEIWDKSGAKIV